MSAIKTLTNTNRIIKKGYYMDIIIQYTRQLSLDSQAPLDFCT